VPTTLIALHGFTMNGAGLRYMLEDLMPPLADVVRWVFPDAPHTASPESALGIAALLGVFRAKPPNLEWWNASEDGRTYNGWDTTRESLRSIVEREAALGGGRVGVFGFSQGAAVAAALAGLSEQGAFPKLDFAVLVAGFVPRADAIAPLFAVPLRIPSLHVWGSSDSFARHAPALRDRFAPETRAELEWPGRHVVPTSGAPAEALIDFVRRHSADPGR